VLLTTFLCLTAVSFGIVVLMLPRRSQASLPAKRLQLILAIPRAAEKGYLGPELPDTTPQLFRSIENSLEHTKLLQYVRTLLLRAQSSASAGGMLVLCAAFYVVTLLVLCWRTSSFVIAFLFAVVAAYLPLAWLKFKGRRRLAAFETVLPDCIDMCARSLQAGHSLVAAIGIVGEDAPEPAKTEFGEVFKKQNYGLPLRDALMQMLDRVPSRDLRMVVTGMLIQKETGGNLVEIMKRIAFVIRERIRIQGEVRTHTAQGRLTGWILCLLPPVLLVIINLLNPGYSKVLFQDPFGRRLLYIGIALQIAGAFMIRNIIRSIEA
jgi:tight adherence protein B